jgi:hypothetical protein
MSVPTDQRKEGSSDTSFDRTRADFFEAIGHPMRIKVLEAIAAEPLTFSGLKKRVGIESSGHMTFHLEKLTQLIRTAPDGTYALTDDGREALRLIQTVHGTEISQTAPTTQHDRTLRYRLAGTPKRLLGFAAVIVAVILAVTVAASALSGVPLYSNEQTLQGSLHYVPSGWSTIQFNDSKGAWISDFSFNLAGANFGNQSERENILPLDLEIAHLQGTYLKSLQLQFSTGTVCCLDVFFGTQRGYPWNPVQVNQASGIETISIADFGFIGTASVSISLLLVPPFVNGGGNLSLSMGVQVTLQGAGTVIGQSYSGQFTLPLIIEANRIVVASGPIAG